ncbi:hypothetical protein MMC13_008060 [Lambiella insularis]|nr:hypothetical protein [Lambiella insularis]
MPPASITANATDGGSASLGNSGGRPHAKSLSSVAAGNANFPPPKTDKPRPHVCATCTRSFARLEHLKRHERSHTKEKPFECPECTRCFARRDLLLRHQQKLHMTTTPSSRPRSGRRESTSSTIASGPGRVRKNAVANNANATGVPGSMRPRANTISHVDTTTLGMIAAANCSAARRDSMNLSHHHQAGLNSLRGPGSYEFRGMSTANGHHGNAHGLPKLETHGLNLDLNGSLRTAPPFGGFEHSFSMEHMMFGPGSTVNPAQLHFSDSPHSLVFDTPASPYSQRFPDMPSTSGMIDDDGNFEWMNGFEHQMSFNPANEQAIAGSSPSAISTGSPSGISEAMLDGSNVSTSTASMWQTPMLSQAPLGTDFAMDLSGSTFTNLLPPDHTSPKTFQDQFAGNDMYPSSQSPLTPIAGLPDSFYHPSIMAHPETPTTSAASVSSSNRQSSVTSVSTDSITEATRQALLATLTQHSTFGHGPRKYSQPTISSPLSPGFSARPRSVSNVSLPSTYDLQRYVAAYIQYFHPHLPFLHIPSLSFDLPVYTTNIRTSSGHSSFQHSNIAGGGGCLILAMAAIGALYEFENSTSKDLFEMAKRMIQLYLEERRKADMSAALNESTPSSDNSIQNTPLWLVQAMLLNVIYGHNCGDKTSADIASTHCAALVSLARAAELAHPFVTGSSIHRDVLHQANGTMHGETHSNSTGWQPNTATGFSDQSAWYLWKITEERKRTLFAVFILSSMLVSAYNHAPALTNSEIRLDLPCDEVLWAADSAEAWHAMGGLSAAEQRAPPFSSALSSLLTASQRPHHHQQSMTQAFCPPFGFEMPQPELPPVDFQASTFGCLVLINALHNYIWDTRQRHVGRHWTMQETESMHAHIEPALSAWQAVWASHPHHSLERPNPFGLGPLSADSIPLLDLAYVRLFVNLGRSKEAFWQRDFDGMADELATGAEIVQHADHSEDRASINSHSSSSSLGSPMSVKIEPGFIKQENLPSIDTSSIGQTFGKSSKRERHLRKAAYHAAHSLSLSDKLGVTFADFNSRELPIQSAMCAFDCAQVLAEWVSTVQERVGRYLGVLGKDEIDYESVPAVMYIDTEDTILFAKIDHVLSSAEMKMAIDNGEPGSMNTMTSKAGLPSLHECGYGSKILLVTAYMLEKSAVWPVTCLMARSLETQASHMKDRADNSIVDFE